MNDEINSKLPDFLDTVNERAEKYPISMAEITKEVEEVRSSNCFFLSYRLTHDNNLVRYS